jgi:hypothetical protein
MGIKEMLLKFSRMNGKDMSGLSPSELAEAGTESGKKISEADMQKLLKMLGTTSAKPKPRPFKKGGKVMGYIEGGAVKKKKAKKKKSKMGCVMAGRGGKYRGMS